VTMALQRHPRLISIEGGEGAGKSTVLSALRDALLADGEEVVSTREPGGTPLAECIRELLLGGAGEAVHPQTELLLMFASRAQHVREVVLPALQRGAWVISDRFTDSSYAYQGAGRGLDEGFIAALEQQVVGIEPGLTLLLDLGVAHGRERTRGRDLLGGSAPDRIERERDEFFERVRDCFLARAAAHPDRFRVIDASPDAASVAASASAALAEHRKCVR
jgi:dTMP kinase